MSVGFYVNLANCIGCRTCQVACKDRHNIQDAGPRIRRVDSFECGTYPEVGLYHMVVSCNHCENPACVAKCPVGALYQDENGVVMHDDELCIRCQTCVRTCPYGAPQYLESEDLIVKCDTCRALRAEGKNPTCVDACPMRAIEFGDFDELKAAHPTAVSELPSLPPASTTTPHGLWEPTAFAQNTTFSPIVL